MARGKADGPTGKVFSVDAVAALLTSLSVTSISMKQYEMMSSMDGVKTAAAFQHDFRAVISKAKQLKARMDSGEEFQGVKPGNKRSAKAMTTPPTTPARAKATPKAPSKPRAKRPRVDIDEEMEEPVTSSRELQSKFVDAFQYRIKQELDIGGDVNVDVDLEVNANVESEHDVLT